MALGLLINNNQEQEKKSGLGLNIPKEPQIQPEEPSILSKIEQKVSEVSPVYRGAKRLAKFEKEAIGNIPSSALEMGKGIAQVVTSPKETAKGMLDIAQGATGIGTEEDSQKWEGVKDFFIQRYGGIENVKNTLKTDPVGFASDLSAVLSGGGAVLGGLGKVSKLGTVGELGKTMSTVGKIYEPISLAKSGVTKAIKMLPESLAEKAYSSAVKFPTTLSAEEKASKVATGLKEGIIPTKSGLNELRAAVDSINSEIESIINKSAKSGISVSSDLITKKLEDLRPFFEETVNPKPFLDELDNLKKNFIEAHGAEIPIDKAQRIKQNTYSLLKRAYGEMKDVSKEGQKALARGIKEEIASKYPEVASLNARESKLLNLEGDIERAVNRISNKDLMGLGSAIPAGVAGTVGGWKAAVTAFVVKSLLDNPTIKSKLAFAITKTRPFVPSTKMASTFQSLVQSSRIPSSFRQKFEEKRKSLRKP